MKFRMGNDQIVLQGDPGLNNTKVSLKAMMREIERKGHGVLIEFGNLAVGESSSVWQVPEEVE